MSFSPEQHTNNVQDYVFCVLVEVMSYKTAYIVQSIFIKSTSVEMTKYSFNLHNQEYN